MATPSTLYRASIVACAAEWLIVGLLLGDVLDTIDTGGPRPLQLVSLALFVLTGVSSVVGLLRRGGVGGAA